MKVTDVKMSNHQCLPLQSLKSPAVLSLFDFQFWISLSLSLCVEGLSGVAFIE